MGINNTQNNTKTQNTQSIKQNIRNEETNIKRIIKYIKHLIITYQRVRNRYYLIALYICLYLFLLVLF
jgi:hypothetical protein